jgi:hypothetical protein
MSKSSGPSLIGDSAPHLADVKDILGNWARTVEVDNTKLIYQNYILICSDWVREETVR